MTTEVKVPDIGDFKNVPVISILVKVGDTVAKEDPLLELESDKATMEVPSPAAGKVVEIKVAEGDKVSEGTVIVLLEGEGAAAAPAPAAAPAAAPAPAAPAASADDGLTPIPSPLVGTFYRAGSPDADPFVAVGSRVNKDTVVCIIEAMKVMNEIKAETSGVVKKILVENATVVQFGQPMFLIEKG